MSRQPYNGQTRKLLLAFDVGTTFSGVSYSIMDPGEVPEIRHVTRYPAQVQAGADSKIPSIIYYNRDGNVFAVGAEATREGIEGIAEEEGWTKAEWFKLHLRPRGQRWTVFDPYIPPLPPNQTVVKVFSDYVKYLYDCTKAYIKETHANGEILWGSLEANIDFVFTHPNGWEGHQQSQLREAAQLAGLVKDNDQASSRISFVTEGEASLHYCINSGLKVDGFEKGQGIVIVDAGGGTIDISAYKGKNKVFQEICTPQCHFQGAVFVTSRAHEHIQDTLRGSRFADDVPSIVDAFDKRTKHAFRDETTPQFIKFAPTRESEPDLGIRSGQLKLQGATIAKFFEPSIACIVTAIEGQLKINKTPISAVFLVGGFAASDWLYTQVKNALAGKVAVSRPDSNMSKAVSDGAVSFHLDHFVAHRVSKAYYGNKMQIWYNPNLPHHLKRAHLVKPYPVVGTLALDCYFDIILPKDQLVAEAKEYRHSYSRYFPSDKMVSTISEAITCYNGDSSPSSWTDEQPELYNEVCRVEADVSAIKHISAVSSLGISCYRIDFDIVLLFGLTELRAQIAWLENGIEKRSPAKVVHEAN